MKKRFLLSLLLISVFYVCAVCQDNIKKDVILSSASNQTSLGKNLESNDYNKENFKLRIKTSSWSGWSRNYKPKEVTNEYVVMKGKKYIINSTLSSSSKFVFTIEKINNDNITIKTEKAFSDRNDGTINLKSKKTRFIIRLNNTTKLKTPSFDAGDTYYLTLIK